VTDFDVIDVTSPAGVGVRGVVESRGKLAVVLEVSCHFSIYIEGCPSICEMNYSNNLSVLLHFCTYFFLFAALPTDIRYHGKPDMGFPLLSSRQPLCGLYTNVCSRISSQCFHSGPALVPIVGILLSTSYLHLYQLSQTSCNW
jgi:hypothetical protein